MEEISLHILDIVQNSIAAGAAAVFIEVLEERLADRLTVRVTDDGCGMTEEMAERAQDPFTTSRTTRKVGLGIPLFKAGCLACEGSFELRSAPGKGTVIAGTYRISHIDRPPLGDVASTVYLTVLANPAVDIRFLHGIDDRRFEFDTAEIRQALGDVPLDYPDVQQWMLQTLQQGEKDLHGGASSI